MKKLLLAVLIGMFFSANAYAYIDPGTGMLLIQGLIAAIGAALVFIRHPIKSLKKLFSKKKDK
jgi:hypothetical protein